MLGLVGKLKNIPIAFNGIALSLITLAQIYPQLHMHILALLCLSLSIIIFVIKLFKYSIHQNVLLNELDNYVNGGFLPLFTMYVAGLSTFLHRYNQILGEVIWYLAFVAHLTLMVYLYYSHQRQKNLSLILPNWFIPPIGFIAIGLAAESSVSNVIAHWIFLFSDAVIVPISLAIIYRQIVKPLTSFEMYTTGIYAAPLSLLILAMLKDHSLPFYELQLTILFYANIIFNLFSVVGLVLCLRKRECIPCFACFTFPFAVSALANLKYAKIDPAALSVSYIALLLSSIMTVYTVGMIINQHMSNLSES
jgi:exfoliative toxin A/B